MGMHLIESLIALSFILVHFALFGVLVAGMIAITIRQYAARNRWRKLAGMEPLSPPFDPFVTNMKGALAKCQYALAEIAAVPGRAQAFCSSLKQRLTVGLFKAPLHNHRRFDPVNSK